MLTRDFCFIAVAAAAVLSACSEPTGSRKEEAGPPATIVFVSGDNQSAVGGATLPVRPVAQVRDQAGHGVPGVSVVFTVFEGDGSIEASGAVVTDESGNATAPVWTLGKVALPQSLRASITVPGAAPITGVAHATVATNYNLEVRFFGPPVNSIVSGVFMYAAARIKAAITGDVIDVAAETTPRDLSSNTDGCGMAGLPTAFSENIDDIIIFATVSPIDGPNNILGSAYPCFIRDPAPDQQTLIGIMQFDSDDMESMILRGNFTDVITHEMLHVVGIGTLWDEYHLREGATTTATRYTGALGVGGCVAVGGATVCPGSIPLEQTGGSGTRDSHWSEAVFFNELMTGFVNVRSQVPTGLLNPLSLMSLQSLADMRYVVNQKAADPYAVPNPASGSILGQLNVGTPPAQWERVSRPRFKVNRAGRITRDLRQ
jgi:hypothetical protein